VQVKSGYNLLKLGSSSHPRMQRREKEINSLT